ncbi:hypothetical protein [Mangrovibacterium diazotrophicum]|uniref:Uncharacterized protein n=1 Tax=Mangrovibacterium diazotrophicum TaxID=1261403 RepID=A0A419W3Z6_9BACT|nr:hypothetical protein [Mangrovibacterium diazotrophicum]RKD90169.1 hypothetical protein BC643_0505 [Mangrovibacterium diazotrophicum]
MRKIIWGFIAFFWTGNLFAYNYSEHKDIGDVAFSRLLADVSNQRNTALFFQFLNIQEDEEAVWYFTDLSVKGGQQISYGVLNGLSGDHCSNPLLLEKQLRLKNSVMQQILLLHNQYMDMGYTSAPDGKLTHTDFAYALQAAVNLGHFYEYDKTFQQQLRHFNKEFIRQCQNPSLVRSIFKELNGTNAINMYVSLHAVAIDLAEQSGRLAKTNPEEAKVLLFYAFLFNGFADHFLEDCFAAGHLVVRRTSFASITNNKALHDFYNDEGCTVVNREADIWRAYGDKAFNHTHDAWEKDTSLLAIKHQEYTDEADRIIKAVHLSLSDVWNAFEQSYSNENHIPFYNLIPDDKKLQPDFLIAATPALKLVPIPFNSDLNTLFPDSITITDSMQKAGQTPYYRNFVRSRIANSFIIGFNGPAFHGRYYEGVDFRVNFGNPVSIYTHNERGGKRGTVDYWMGYTLAYSLGDIKAYKDDTFSPYFAQQVKAGLRNNLDIWVGEKRFLGLSNYTEAGVQFVDGATEFVFTPSIGVQFGSLLNINYYNLPTWLRIPLEYIVPLKLKYGVVLSSHSPTAYFNGLDIDIVF